MKRIIPRTTEGPLRNEVQATDTAGGRARFLRDTMSPPELALWFRIKQSRRLDYPFRKQHPLGPYIADFYCHAAAIVVEIDGDHHAHQRGHDAARDAWMAANGIMVLRFTAREMVTNGDGVASTCMRIARERAVERGAVDEEKKPLPASKTRPPSR
ncbi:MAG: DUF559 domain-containing protein [Phycisphaerales bacterium]